MSDNRDEFDEQPGKDGSGRNPGIEPKLGNTLDYYNDDMSRNVVKSLFDTNSKPADGHAGDTGSSSHEPTGIVKGFETERRPDTRYPMDETYPRLSAADAEEPASLRRRRGGAVTQASNNNPDPLDEGDYKFSLYRNKQPLNRKRSEPEEEPEAPRTRRRPRLSEDDGDGFDTPPHRPSKVYKKIEPEREFETQKADPAPARRQRPSSASRQQPARKPRFAIHRGEDDDDEYDEDDGRRGPSMRMIALGGSIFAVVLLVAIVVFQLFSLNRRLVVAEEAADLSNERQTQISALTLENSDLLQQLNAALAEVTRLETLADAGQGTGAAANQDPAAPAQPNRYHTVGPNQTLSGIAAQWFPGDPTGMQRIIDANGITNPSNIQINQQLIIPH
ncbi:MAG: LysM peptidoglycan-binding domain-containing protein [Defluviitaleaceae bacterium]|nr:LysM peptidoglycan-binding domain-containing protein [Defluviitaleaceae bacterium]